MTTLASSTPPGKEEGESPHLPVDGHLSIINGDIKGSSQGREVRTLGCRLTVDRLDEDPSHRLEFARKQVMQQGNILR